jgi:hypothetical protein
MTRAMHPVVPWLAGYLLQVRVLAGEQWTLGAAVHQPVSARVEGLVLIIRFTFPFMSICS